ncbi:hypothetical protein D082_07390 [Synechocystis sp. PCC 6714]|nr:hypothetical protein D082_07390 [Synechocystis sp. PCC 6714]
MVEIYWSGRMGVREKGRYSCQSPKTLAEDFAVKGHGEGKWTEKNHRG